MEEESQADLGIKTECQHQQKTSCPSAGLHENLGTNEGRLKVLQLRLNALNQSTVKLTDSTVETSVLEENTSIKKDVTSEDEIVMCDLEPECIMKEEPQVDLGTNGNRCEQLQKPCCPSNWHYESLGSNEGRLKMLQWRLKSLNQRTTMDSTVETFVSEESIKKDVTTSEEEIVMCDLEPECIMKEESQALQVDLDGEIKEVTNAWVQEPFLCVRCGFTSTTLKNLAEHNKQHCGFTPYSCAVCGYQTTRFWHIKNHMVAHTGKAVLYSCPLCDFVSSYLKNVKRHIRLHVGKELPDEIDSGRIVIPPIRCLPMNKAHLSPEVAVGTKGRKSTTVKSYNCSQCEYKTAYHSNLIRHSRKHTGERPYPCTKCPYRAIQHSDLTRHIRTHTGEKPYECQMCNYKSAQAGDLAVHIKRHASCEIYECFICGFKAIQKSYVTRHINRKHSQDLISHLKPK